MPKTLSKYIKYSFVRFVHSDEKISARLNDNNYAVQPKEYFIFEYKERTDFMAVELKTIEHLCGLSKLSYDDDGMRKVMGEMGSIIDLMDEIKSFDLEYDDTKDNNEIRLGDTREDVPEESFPTEKLLANAENTDGCYVVPKVVE